MPNGAEEKPVNVDDSSGSGPGAATVGAVGIAVISSYLVLLVVICFAGLVVLWPGAPPLNQPQGAVAPTTETGNAPAPAPAANAQASPTPTPTPGPSEIHLFTWKLQIWDEVRLLLIVIFGGALGSLVHALRSVYWYVGNRDLRRSWLVKYMLLPFAGSALALIFYVVVRGGFFAAQAGVQQTSPFGFVALAAMVGLFSEQAVLKLKEIAETVLSKPAPGSDHKPQGDAVKPT